MCKETDQRAEFRSAIFSLLASCEAYADEEGLAEPPTKGPFNDQLLWVNEVIRHAHEKLQNEGEDQVELMAAVVIGAARHASELMALIFEEKIEALMRRTGNATH